jgi:hypothetical protein
MQILTDEIRTARKHHKCDACYWWDRSNFGKEDVTADEWLIVEGCKADNYKVIPQSKYKYTSFVYDGMIQVFKGRLDMDKICIKYDLYPEE